MEKRRAVLGRRCANKEDSEGTEGCDGKREKREDGSLFSGFRRHAGDRRGWVRYSRA